MDKLNGAYTDELGLVMLIRYKGASCHGKKLRKGHEESKKAGRRPATGLEVSILLPLKRELHYFI